MRQSGDVERGESQKKLKIKTELSGCHESMVFCLNRDILCAVHCSESSQKCFTNRFMEAELNTGKVSGDKSVKV